jgi:peptidoglycan/LPS O-acetylase OafA/YrhL
VIRSILGAIAGYAVWTAVFLGGSLALAIPFADEQEAFDAGGDYRAAGPLLAFLALSVGASLAAGWTAARIARTRVRGTVLVMGLALLVTGIGVQASVWSRMPVWYHLAFLGLLLPVCLSGGRIRARSRRRSGSLPRTP